MRFDETLVHTLSIYLYRNNFYFFERGIADDREGGWYRALEAERRRFKCHPGQVHDNYRPSLTCLRDKSLRKLALPYRRRKRCVDVAVKIRRQPRHVQPPTFAPFPAFITALHRQTPLCLCIHAYNPRRVRTRYCKKRVPCEYYTENNNTYRWIALVKIRCFCFVAAVSSLWRTFPAND